MGHVGQSKTRVRWEFSMNVHSIWCYAGSAEVCAFSCKAERTQMNDNVVIIYEDEEVSAPKEVADFLEEERK